MLPGIFASWEYYFPLFWVSGCKSVNNHVKVYSLREKWRPPKRPPCRVRRSSLRPPVQRLRALRRRLKPALGLRAPGSPGQQSEPYRHGPFAAESRESPALRACDSHSKRVNGQRPQPQAGCQKDHFRPIHAAKPWGIGLLGEIFFLIGKFIDTTPPLLANWTRPKEPNQQFWSAPIGRLRQ